jgi:hypothetical protein
MVHASDGCVSQRHGERQQAQGAPGALEVGDRGDLAVEGGEQFGVERVVADELVAILGTRRTFRQLGALVDEAPIRVGIGVRGRARGVPVDPREQSMRDDG